MDLDVLYKMIKATEKRGTTSFGITRITPREGNNDSNFRLSKLLNPVLEVMAEAKQNFNEKKTESAAYAFNATVNQARELRTAIRQSDHAFSEDIRVASIKHVGSFSSANLTADDLGQKLDIRKGDIVIWNCRARPMTEVDSTDADSVQPIVFEDYGLVMSHNGVVANDTENSIERRTPLDSEIFLHKYIETGSDTKRAVEQLIGGSAYIMYDDDRDMLIVVRDYQPLGKAYLRGLGYMVMSDVAEFAPILGPMDVAVWEYFYYSDLAPYQINEIDIDSGCITVKDFEPQFASSLPVPSRDKAVVLASGGVDSSVAAVLAAKLAGKDVTLVHTRLGQKSDGGELRAVNYLADFLKCELKIIDMAWLGDLGNSPLTDPNIEIPQGDSRFNLKSTVCWTPARNMVMLSALVAVAEGIGASTIYNGFTLEESGSYPDNSQDFFRGFNSLSNFGTLTRPQVRMIEANLMKPEIILLGEHYGLDMDKLWSCDWTPEDMKECGTCGACTLKDLARSQAEELAASEGFSIEKLIAKVTP